MVSFGKKIVKYRVVVLVLAVLLLIPAAIGYVKTRVNYDLLSYLPDTLETVKGQNIMVDEYGMGAFSMIIVENMDDKDLIRMENKIEDVNHVSKVLSYNDFASSSIPRDILPDRLKNAMFNGDAQIMIAMFDNTTSSDDTMNAITDIRKIVKNQAFVSGMGGVTTDIKDLVNIKNNSDDEPLNVFSMDGRKIAVLENTSQLLSLKHGIYIVNGKKIIIK
jgi:uncharacterized membrane protein YdfJ with MMPL/SSD domain